MSVLTAPAPASPRAEAAPLVLKGVDHSARPTWKLRETVSFYRDLLGLPLVHVIAAKGWGPSNHPDFLHFFFDSGRDSCIAFFYYLGTDRPDYQTPGTDHFYNATHTAWRVDTREELVAWKEMLEGKGLAVSPYTRHEVIESIYFTDPNGYPVEITLALRKTDAMDALDSGMTLEAAMQLEDERIAVGEKIDAMESIWRRKSVLVEDYLSRD